MVATFCSRCQSAVGAALTHSIVLPSARDGAGTHGAAPSFSSPWSFLVMACSVDGGAAGVSPVDCLVITDRVVHLDTRLVDERGLPCHALSHAASDASDGSADAQLDEGHRPDSSRVPGLVVRRVACELTGGSSAPAPS